MPEGVVDEIADCLSDANAIDAGMDAGLDRGLEHQTERLGPSLEAADCFANEAAYVDILEPYGQWATVRACQQEQVLRQLAEAIGFLARAP